jgi:hypothetical protein
VQPLNPLMASPAVTSTAACTSLPIIRSLQAKLQEFERLRVQQLGGGFKR